MPRIMAIDYGAKRTGLAVTDPMVIIASPLDFVLTCKLEDFLVEYFKMEEVEKVVIGHPRNLAGGNTDATHLVQAFVHRFRKVFPSKGLVLHDERFTTKMAQKSLLEGGMKKKARRVKGNVDKVSATIILQSYLAGNP